MCTLDIVTTAAARGEKVCSDNKKVQKGFRPTQKTPSIFILYGPTPGDSKISNFKVLDYEVSTHKLEPNIFNLMICLPSLNSQFLALKALL